MDIDKATNTVDKADGFFTRLNSFIKKHPFWFALLVIVGLGYWISTWDLEEEDSSLEQIEVPYVVQELYEIDDYGDTILIDVYSDGTEKIIN